MLHADGRLPVVRFQLIHGELDAEPAPDHPLANRSMQTSERYAEVMVNNANSLLQEFCDAWGHSPELRASLTGSIDDLEMFEHVSFDHAVARMNGYLSASSPEVEPLSASMWSIDLFGGNLDGVTIDRISIRSADDQTHLLVITRDDQVRFSYIHDRVEHPLARECAALFGPGSRLYRVLAGAFDDVEHLDSILGVVEESARGFVSEEQARDLLIRVREAALLQQERELLAYVPPTLYQINYMNGLLEALQ